MYLPAQSTIEMTKPWAWLFVLPDIIENVIEQDGGWWEGDLNGKHGVFPGISSGTIVSCRFCDVIHFFGL